MRSMEAHDVEGSARLAAEDFVLDDRRQLAWERQDVRKALALLFQQYNHFETHMLAVQEKSYDGSAPDWFDDAGNEGVFLSLFEFTADGRLGQWCCFDEDDFWSAYRELETRYYSGEGAQFAEYGLASAEWVTAISENADIDGVCRGSHLEFRWIATASALKDSERTVDDMFRWMRERARQVASQRHWVPVLHWLSPMACAVGLTEIAAVGEDGEEYGWNSIYVAECRDGLLATVREFDKEEQRALRICRIRSHAEVFSAVGEKCLVGGGTARSSPHCEPVTLTPSQTPTPTTTGTPTIAASAVDRLPIAPVLAPHGNE